MSGRIHVDENPHLHDKFPKAIPEPSRTDQVGETHATRFCVERVAHTRAEGCGDYKVGPPSGIRHGFESQSDRKTEH